MMLVNEFVELLDKVDRFEILSTAVDVRHPLPGLARVVEVEHRRNRINPQPVDVILLKPEQRVAEQIVLHLVSRPVENKRAPILVLAFARVRMLVQMSAIKV